MAPFNVRVATEADAEAVNATITAAFHDDPLWSWVFPDPAARAAQYTDWWAIFIRGALPQGWIWMTEGCEAASVWIPPGCPEMSPDDEAELHPVLRRHVGDEHADRVMIGVERFDESHPEGPPHYYLSLLGTHPDHLGKGIGFGLLQANLDRIDAEGMPAYLEASNPANVALYERFGFKRHGEFTMSDEGPSVATMWREALAERK